MDYTSFGVLVKFKLLFPNLFNASSTYFTVTPFLTKITITPSFSTTNTSSLSRVSLKYNISSKFTPVVSFILKNKQKQTLIIISILLKTSPYCYFIYFLKWWVAPLGYISLFLKYECHLNKYTRLPTILGWLDCEIAYIGIFIFKKYSKTFIALG